MYFNHELIKLAWYAVGFGYSLFAGWLIWYTHKYLYLKFHKDESIGWRSNVTGLVERGLYTGAILAGHPEFVAVWLTLKSVSHWERFKADIKSETSSGEPTAKFNGYFVCTGLSIAYGFSGAYVTKWLINCQYITAIVVMIGFVAVHLLLNWYICSKAKKELSTLRKIGFVETLTK